MSLPIERMIDNVVKPVARPNNIEPGALYATHEGVLSTGDIKMKVYTLNNGQRIIDAEDLKSFFGEEIIETFANKQAAENNK